MIESAARAMSRLFSPPLKRSYVRGTVVPDTWAKRILLVACVGALIGAPLVAGYYQLSIAVAIGIGIVGGVATNLLVGVAGQASIGNAAFMAIGAMTAAQAAGPGHLPFPVAVVAGGAAAALVGVLVAVPAMRVRGLYLIIATLALHYVTIFVLTSFQATRVGDVGFVMPSLVFAPLNSIQSSYYVMLVSACVSIVAMRNLLRTRFGRAWAAIARDEMGASVLGIRVRREKVLVFGLTSFMIGIQGALFGYYVGIVNIAPFTFDLAVSYMAMIVIGGLGSVPGSVLGALFVVGLPYAITGLARLLPATTANVVTTHIFDIETILYGLAIVVFLVWERRGLIYMWQRLIGGLATWPLPKALRVADE